MKKIQGKLNNRMVTEKYLDLRLGETKQATEKYLDLRLGELQRGMKEEIREEMRGETVKILQGVDKIITRFDAAEKDHAAHTMLHVRITDELHGHYGRIKKLEEKV